MRKKNSFGDILGAIAKAFFEIIKGFLRLFLKIMVTFGLWLPSLYALLGVILYYGADFQPFSFDVYSVIYVSGGVACVICAVIITVRNLFVTPVKNAMNRRRDKINDQWAEEEFKAREQAERQENERQEREFSPISGEIEDYDEEKLVEEPVEEPLDELDAPEYLMPIEDERANASRLLFDWVPTKKTVKEEPKVRSKPKKEIPEVYFSKLKPNILVHEYKDRFELYNQVGDKTEFIGVEYK